ncbi:hypothetical protein BT96DRAFT_912490 [Gymnopus androsaceus JB14]|uniref:3-isopropylmalate dehydratase n=1 Tax=Gymnopus androsaceus JB14 TaxID=1447944 RepID=A0A6A4IL19_9AGAR|nr:hypothetical protein BT96DRAFT_912490 [Gymnopus androsaceus JB14]
MPAPVNPPRTLYDKVWDDHVVRNAGRAVRRPDCTLATVDHNVPTSTRKNFSNVKSFIEEPDSRAQCVALEENVKEFGLTYFGMTDKRQGEFRALLTMRSFINSYLPGITCVCGDSHTSTHGAFGSLAFGIGTSEVEHKSKNMRITVDGELIEGVTSKDVVLHIIGVIGTAGGTGAVIEYAGSVIRGLSMEARMSICNMSIEAGARAGMIAPDEITFAYLRDRPLAPKGETWDRAVAYWKTLKSDPEAKFDIEVNIPASDIIPTVTWGTSPQDVAPITGSVPDPSTIEDPVKRASVTRSLTYMGLTPNTPMEEIKIDKVFIGSCTNSRIEDLRSAAKIVLAAGSEAKVAPGVLAMIVPGSGLIKKQAEAEGLDAVFKRAGFDWRERDAQCLSPGERCASTSNRNFEGRQGAGGRTHLVSPAMAAAAAITGKLTDVRKFFGATAEANIAAGPKLKLTSAFDFMDDPVLPSPDPVQTTAPSTGGTSLPSSEPLSSSVKFTIVKGIAAPMHIENVDTDMIIPKQFLKTLKRTGLSDALFYNFRFDPATGGKTDFVLNREPYTQAKILVCTGKNFGCGSSREHAPWSFFAEIFRSNSMQNGMLPVAVPQEDCLALAEDAEAGLELEVDLEKQEIRRPNGKPPVSFTTDPFRRHCLLNGLDDIGLTLQDVDEIESFEHRRSEVWPWLDGFGYKAGKIPVAAKKTAKKMDW